ncbi:MAG: AtpZ/AtpI family protein [Bryobacteraceae bacterium]
MKNPWAKGGAYAGLAFVLPAAMYGAYLAGEWVDRQLGTKIFYLVGIIAGFAAGLWETMRQVDRIENGPRRKNETGR